MEFLFYEMGLRQRKQELGVLAGGVASQRTRFPRMLESETSPEFSPQQGQARTDRRPEPRQQQSRAPRRAWEPEPAPAQGLAA